MRKKFILLIVFIIILIAGIILITGRISENDNVGAIANNTLKNATQEMRCESNEDCNSLTIEPGYVNVCDQKKGLCVQKLAMGDAWNYCVVNGGSLYVPETGSVLCFFSDSTVCEVQNYFNKLCNKGDCLVTCNGKKGLYDCNGQLIVPGQCN